jgi:hypothetical protein
MSREIAGQLLSSLELTVEKCCAIAYIDVPHLTSDFRLQLSRKKDVC